MSTDSLKKFDEIVDRLKKQQAFGFACRTFLLSISDNEDRLKKYNGSYSGHALDLCIKSVQSSLVMFCNRHWDENSDVLSIPNAITQANCCIEKIVMRHKSEFESMGIDRDARDFCDYFESLKRDTAKCQGSEIRSQLRVLRTEELAHLKSASRDRTRAESAIPGFSLDGLTLRALLGFSKETLQLSERLVYLRERLSPDFADRTEIFESYYDQFWEHLPNFKEMEDKTL